MTLLVRAADLVLGRRVAPPPELPAGAIPEGVVLREGRLLPALGGFFARLHAPAAAVALRRTIVVHPDVTLTPRLLAHELAHLRQWREIRLFPVRYALETIRHGYLENRYEREARAQEATAAD